tara:strand:- start:701 stop:1543 length:843 start_codon:yes stop_codon:yes gene_type:complete
MALPSSGVLTLDDIQTEFGGTNPIDLSDYYRGGGLVPDTATNAGIPTSGVISVTDFYGAVNLLSLDFTLQGAVVDRTNGTFTGVSIGTANTNRMVVLQGGSVTGSGTLTAPTSVTIGGITASLVRLNNNYVAYAKVPTGTTATIVISGGTGTFTTQIYTLNTVNTAPTQNLIATLSIPASTNGSSTMTQNPVDTEGVFIWGGWFQGAGPGSPPRAGTGLSTTNSSGVTLTLNWNNSIHAGFMGYSECTTTDSRTATSSGFNNPSKGAAVLYSAFTYFQAN